MGSRINQKKYENVILYLCRGLGGSISGKKKLAKLLYYVDFDHFEYRESMKSVTGDKYKAWRMGPVPEHYMDIVSKLEKEGKLKKRSVPRETPRLPRPVAVLMVLFSEFRRDFVVTKGAVVKPKSGQHPQHQ